MAHFDFGNYWHDGNEYKPIKFHTTHFGHETFLPPNHEELDFIFLTRHPYERIISYYLSVQNEVEEYPNPEQVEIFLEKNLFSNPDQLMYKSFNLIQDRKPNYVVKLENLYEDLLKIPFVKNSKLYGSGILEEMCRKKINDSFIIEN